MGLEEKAFFLQKTNFHDIQNGYYQKENEPIIKFVLPVLIKFCSNYMAPGCRFWNKRQAAGQLLVGLWGHQPFFDAVFLFLLECAGYFSTRLIYVSVLR